MLSLEEKIDLVIRDVAEIKALVSKKKPIPRELREIKAKQINAERDEQLRLYIIPYRQESSMNFVTNKEIFSKMADILKVNNIPAMSRILINNGFLPGKRYVNGHRHRGFYLTFLKS